MAGRWEARGSALCFTYDGDPQTSCWHVREDAGGLTAVLLENGTEGGFLLRLEREDTAPLDCPAEGLTS